jgi:hypothetical protein
VEHAGVGMPSAQPLTTKLKACSTFPYAVACVVPYLTRHMPIPSIIIRTKIGIYIFGICWNQLRLSSWLMFDLFCLPPFQSANSKIQMSSLSHGK